MWHEQAITVIMACDLYCCLLPQWVWSFTHMLLELSDCNKMMLWPGCEGRARCRLHKKNVRFVIKRRGCCCNLLVGIALNVQFTTNKMCTKNNTMWWSLLLLVAAVWSFAHMLLGLSDRNITKVKAAMVRAELKTTQTAGIHSSPWLRS